MKFIIRVLIILFFLMISFTSLSQKDTIKFVLDNNINGSYTKYGDNTNIVNVGFIGDNSVNYKKIKLNTTSNYSISFRDTIIANEFIEKTNIGYNNLFISSFYTSSFVRSVKNDNSFGLGYGRKILILNTDISISYAILYQKTLYRNGSVLQVNRNSFRTKIKYDGDKIGFSSELYYQPNLKLINDYIIYGNIKLVFLPKNKLNIVMQDAVNYISRSDVRMIHNLTFGIGYTFKN
jgi:hypothetical protein